MALLIPSMGKLLTYVQTRVLTNSMAGTLALIKDFGRLTPHQIQ
jgi:hypothetical protein